MRVVFEQFEVNLLCAGLIITLIGIWLIAMVIGARDNELVQFIGLILSLIGMVIVVIALYFAEVSI